ncbi:MAG: NUDIX hydrolase [bacterium]
MNEWKKIKEEPFRAGFRKMIKKFFILPNGQEKDFDIKQEGPAVCVLALTKNGNVILAKQYRPGPEKKLLEMPGGGVEKDENPLEAAKRELLEETGYAGEMQLVGECLDCAYSTMKRYCYVAKNCVRVQDPCLDENEFVEIVQMPLPEFRNLLRSGQMTDVEVGYLALDYLGLL